MFNLNSNVKRNMVLALAAIALTGCGAAPTQSGGWTVKKTNTQIVELGAKTGHVQIAFPGLSAYKTLATTNDIERVRLTVSNGPVFAEAADGPSANLTTIAPEGRPMPMPMPIPGYSRTIELKRADLVKNMVKVNFDKVPAGHVTLRVQAFDKGGDEIGAGTTGSKVAAGKTTEMNMAVRLHGNTGNVAASVTFLDGDGVAVPWPAKL